LKAEISGTQNMDLKTLILTFKTNGSVNQTASKLRGFIAHKFQDSVLLHQHHSKKFVYYYPLYRKND